MRPLLQPLGIPVVPELFIVEEDHMTRSLKLHVGMFSMNIVVVKKPEQLV